MPNTEAKFWVKLKCGHIRMSFFRDPKGKFYCGECKGLVEVEGPHSFMLAMLDDGKEEA